ncbi:MAG: glutamine-hydrolyzing GMP synthase [Chitinophagales bacterium]|nr:glutamine-hydrolyzing GMP synthase [Chitinophagales bacterium]
MHQHILIIDFGSQYTQLIARRIREFNVYCEIHPFHNLPETGENTMGIILSGSPFSVNANSAPKIDLNKYLGKTPVLGICYGAQYIAKELGGLVESSDKREYGRANLNKIDTERALFHGFDDSSQVWMSHGDTIKSLPNGFNIIGSTSEVEIAAYMANSDQFKHPVYGIQFHPEVTHSIQGGQLLSSFIYDVCHCKGDWTPASFVEETVASLKETVNNGQVLLGLSGGVDSSVAAMLLHKAIGRNLHCIFVDNGLLRKHEFQEVLSSYEHMGLNIKGVDAGAEFLKALDGISDPEEKRKIIGKVFIDVFEREANLIENVDWLAQGTIYPDVIESVSVHGPSAMIKSHHNVGGLPDILNLKIVEPLRNLFKDEVRRVGAALGLHENILHRHPFPGPGLAIRIIGEITEDRVKLLQEADDIFISNLKSHNLYDKVWQSATMLLPIKSVGVMGDERTYEHVVALRSVNSQDGMTADWSQLPHDFLAQTSNEIINKVKGINRVVYDISSKPPATIEWE